MSFPVCVGLMGSMSHAVFCVISDYYGSPLTPRKIKNNGMKSGNYEIESGNYEIEIEKSKL